MKVLTPEQTAQYAKQAGFKGEALVVAVAIAGAESDFDTEKRGDVGLETPKWGASIGLWQIRSLRTDMGTGRERDESRLMDPPFNARSAYSISRGGTNWKPWSTWTNKRYQQYLSEARLAVAGGQLPLPPPPAGRQYANVDQSIFLGGIPRLPTPPELLLGGRYVGDTGVSMTAASMDLTADEMSEITLRFSDPNLGLVHSGQFGVLQRFRLTGRVWTVTGWEVQQGQAGPDLMVSAQPEAPVTLRYYSPRTLNDLSPTEYMSRVATAVGLGFVGEPSGARKTVGPEQVEDTNSARKTWKKGDTRVETAMELSQRLARELGFRSFEAGGVWYFGSPRWLAQHGARAQLVTPTGTPSKLYGRERRTVGFPNCRVSAVLGGTSASQATVRASLLPEDSDDLRPGMGALVVGMPGLPPGDRLLTRVSRDLLDLNALTTVEIADFPEGKEGTARTIADDTASATAPHVAVPRGARLAVSDLPTYYGQAGDGGRRTSYTTPWGISVQVHRLVLGAFQAACEDAAKSSTWRPALIGSYANRPNVNNRSVTSLHAWALAWDFYSTPRYQSDIQGPTFAPPAEFRAAFKRHGFYVGAEFSHVKDYPHIEWAAAPP